MTQQHWDCLEEASDAKPQSIPDFQAGISILSQWGQVGRRAPEQEARTKGKEVRGQTRDSYVLGHRLV